MQIKSTVKCVYTTHTYDAMYSGTYLAKTFVPK